MLPLTTEGISQLLEKKNIKVLHFKRMIHKVAKENIPGVLGVG